MKRAREKSSQEEPAEKPKKRRIKKESDLEREHKGNPKRTLKKHMAAKEELKDSIKSKGKKFEIPTIDVNEVGRCATVDI